MPSDDAARTPPARLLDLTAQIVAAHVSRNPVATDQLPELIRAVRQTLGGLGQPGAPAEPARREPAVPVRRSVKPDRIICLECGAAMTMLKRHLLTEHGLTPAAYRERWSLGREYPMVAPRYAEMRSGLARQIGLGRKRGASEDALDETAAEPDSDEAEAFAAAPAEAEPVEAPPRARGGRKRAAPQQAAPEPDQTAPSAQPKPRGRRRAKSADDEA